MIDVQGSVALLLTVSFEGFLWPWHLYLRISIRGASLAIGISILDGGI